jgi:hypothetical protein
LPNFDGLVMAGGSDPGDERALNFVRVPEHGRSGSGLAGTARGWAHPHAPKTPFRSRRIGVPHGGVSKGRVPHRGIATKH